MKLLFLSIIIKKGNNITQKNLKGPGPPDGVVDVLLKAGPFDKIKKIDKVKRNEITYQ